MTPSDKDGIALQIDAYLATYRWLGPMCLFGVAINLYAGINDLAYPKGWYSYLLGVLSLGCAGLCLWAWRAHRALARSLKERE